VAPAAHRRASKGLAPKIVSEFAGVLERAAQHSTVLLVEQNLSVVKRLAQSIVVLDHGEVVHSERSATSTIRLSATAPGSGGGRVNIFLVLTFSGVALGAIYFLAASGLSLIYGLMDVLNSLTASS